MKLSILVPSRNMSYKIDDFFKFIFNGKADLTLFEVVVVDSSTDDSMAVLKKHRALHPENIKLIHYDRKVRCGTARNIAYLNSSGEYVYCMDIDDLFFSEDTLSMVLSRLDGKDIYYCPFCTMLDTTPRMCQITSIEDMVRTAVGVLTKMYRRELYVYFPDYMPEDVAAHYKLIDKCKSFSYFDFCIYKYDNTNKSAISRTFDHCLRTPNNIIKLADTDYIERNGISQEYIEGTLHNLADMFGLRDKLSNECVRTAWLERFATEYWNIMNGKFVH